MSLTEARTWVIFYLISFVVLLVALFFTTQGIMLGVGLTLIIVVIGVNFMIVYTEIKRVNSKKALVARLTQKDNPELNQEEEKSGFLS